MFFYKLLHMDTPVFPNPQNTFIRSVSLGTNKERESRESMLSANVDDDDDDDIFHFLFKKDEKMLGVYLFIIFTNRSARTG